MQASARVQAHSNSLRMATAILPALLACIAAPALATPAEDYNAIQRDYESWLLRENPETASALGVRDYDDRVSDPSIAAMDRRAGDAQRMLTRLDAIDASGLTPANRVNRAIMHRMLSEVVEGNRFGQRQMLFTTYYGWHQGFASMQDSVPLNNGADYRSYLTRLAQYPTVNRESIAITRQAVQQGFVLPCSVLGNMERSISGLITTDPATSRYYAPFTRNRPQDVSAADWQRMQEQARTIISGSINPALEEHRRFFVNDYLPHCAQSDSVSAQPNGAAYYAFRIRQETTTDLTAQQIHDLGMAEVTRIRGEMDQLATSAGFANRAAFIADLRSNPKYYATTPEELMMHTARITRRIDGYLPRLFTVLPRNSYTIREIPAETAEGTTTAYYGYGSLAAGNPGTYYVNTSKLNQRPYWEIPALSMHEAVPGHHLQLSLQQELDLPMWRRQFTGFTAFVEGWGLYSESLGTDVGLYDTPETQMGRLSYQMWRACRLVVDTGIHAFGWDKQRAIAFMRENSAMSDANIEAEVNRYISWPGQALGYKVGELRIQALRAEAERTLGPKFDIRHFHDAVLAQGAVPMDVLETQIREWIAAQNARPSS